MTYEQRKPSPAPVNIPIPAADLWQTNFIKLGAKWADWQDKNPVFAFGWEAQVWYYDGGRVYLELVALTGDSWPAGTTPMPAHPPSWYAANILDQYSAYIMAQNWVGCCWRHFPYGLLLSYQRTGNKQHAAAVSHLAARNAYIGINLRWLRKHSDPPGAFWSPCYMRESAYATDCLIANQLLTGTVSPLLQVGVYDCIVADIDEYFDPNGRTYLGKSDPLYPPPNKNAYVNNFMVGLALETLINYYEMTALNGSPDTNIPAYVKQTLDNLWEHCFEQSSGAMYYNSDPVNGAAPGIGVIYTASTLNQLAGGAWAWYYAHSHNQRYQQIGDMIFQAGVRGAGQNCPLSVTNQDYAYMGKEYCQNFKWSPDFIRYRSGPYGVVTEPFLLRAALPPANEALLEVIENEKAQFEKFAQKEQEEVCKQEDRAD